MLDAGHAGIIVRTSEELRKTSALHLGVKRAVPNQILFLVSVSAVIVSVYGRKQAIGGWLLYFYYWIFAVLYISLRDVIGHLHVYRPSFGEGQVNHEALVLAVFPRLLVYVAVATVAIILLVKREWLWVERLRVTLLAGIIIAGFSVWLDVRYFPKSTVPNAGRWIGLCLWLIYFSVSNRVERVFRTKDWEEVPKPAV